MKLPTRHLLAIGALAAIAPSAAAAPSTPGGPRLDGRYQVRYERQAFDSDGRTVWRLDPRCARFACDTSLQSTTGLTGVLQFRVSSETYVLRTRLASAFTCDGDDGPYENAYVRIRTVRIDSFAGAGAVAKFANGEVNDEYRLRPGAKQAGCDKTFTRSSGVRFKRL
jgi:hypothetical protein